jgi:hypothetical protein
VLVSIGWQRRWQQACAFLLYHWLSSLCVLCVTTRASFRTATLPSLQLHAALLSAVLQPQCLAGSAKPAAGLLLLLLLLLAV